jgi:hypothetical protein
MFGLTERRSSSPLVHPVNFTPAARTKALSQHKSPDHDGKWSGSDEKPEHRVVSLSGADGAEKQEIPTNRFPGSKCQRVTKKVKKSS